MRFENKLKLRNVLKTPLFVIDDVLFSNRNLIKNTLIRKFEFRKASEKYYDDEGC
jgi:hypothetical protein